MSSIYYIGISQCLGVVYLLSNCKKICQKYVTLVELEQMITETQEELEEKAIAILQGIVLQNFTEV